MTYGSNDGYTEHVDSVRVLKRDLELLRRPLMDALDKAEAARDSAVLAVGQPGEGEPESARLIRLWTAQNVDEIRALIRGVDNTNEEADAYLRLFGG